MGGVSDGGFHPVIFSVLFILLSFGMKGSRPSVFEFLMVYL